MKKILEEISSKAIEHGWIHPELSGHQLASTWIGFDPVSNMEIDALEVRLGMKLPQDYKEFLQLTNGFLAANNVEPSFCLIEKVDYLKNVDLDLIEIWTSAGNIEVGNKLETAIKVGGFDEEQYFFLIPPCEENANWEYWIFASWAPGETIFHSLMDYFKQVLEFTTSLCDEK
jgi:hypothetical protein